MKTIPEYFGSMVFDEREMKSRLTAKAYKSLKIFSSFISLLFYGNSHSTNTRMVSNIARLAPPSLHRLGF